MKIKYLSPSYKRSGERSTTQGLFPFVTLVVMESEADKYRAAGNSVVTVPDEIQGNLCRVLNYCLDNFFDDADCLVLLDDDHGPFLHFENGKRGNLLPSDFEEFCERNSIICREFGFHFWGVNPTNDKGSYREHTPFSTLSYIGGPFRAHLRTSELRYDERLFLKDDYDMTLQQIHRYGGCLRVNSVTYTPKQSKQTGGCSMQRNSATEQEQLAILRRKWGASIIRADLKSKKKFDYNPILKIPIRGV